MTPALSPSRAADFKQCPLLFRFRTIDRLEGPPSPAAARGTLVHAVLEHLFDLPAADLAELFSIDARSWLAEADLTEEFYDTFGSHLPAALRAELASLRYRLQRS